MGIHQRRERILSACSASAKRSRTGSFVETNGMTLHKRREKNRERDFSKSNCSVTPVRSRASSGSTTVSCAIRKIGVSAPICSEQTKRRQDKWDNEREMRDKQKKLDKLVKERQERLKIAEEENN